MASILVRQIPDFVKAKLKARAVRHGRSMEEEVRDILKCAAAEDPAASKWVADIHERFAKLGGLEVPERNREPIREPPDFR
jgi:antitoxin FitA